MNAQLNSSDELGWLLDMMTKDEPRGDLCSKAIARAKSELIEERQLLFDHGHSLPLNQKPARAK